MADAFANVVMCWLPLGYSLRGLAPSALFKVDFYRYLVWFSEYHPDAGIGVLTMLAAVTTGSGNAPFYAFLR